ncbi:MAG: hypothetical protein ACR2HY_05040 [Acidimicrobiales bacterium]
MNRSRFGRWPALAVGVVTMLVAFAAPVTRAGAVSGIGYDISWPQCGKPLPPTPAFAVVGVGDGKPYTDNPCLATEYRWAQASGLPPAFYMNTANPGPDTTAINWYAQHSPNAACSPADQRACAYNYGYNAAAQAYAYAGSQAAAGTGHTWWLDVETGNSWSPTNLGANLADIAGSIDYLSSRKVPVGVYSTPYQWGKITGGARLAGLPNWAAGARDASQASVYCSTKSFSGGPVLLSQFVEGRFDRAYACPGADAVINPSPATADPLGDLLNGLKGILKGLGLNTG